MNPSSKSKGKGKKKVRSWKAWAGVVHDTIHRTVESDSKYSILVVYPSKRVAKLAYEEVIPITITENRPSRRVKQ